MNKEICKWFRHVRNEDTHCHFCKHPSSQTGRCGFKRDQIDECPLPQRKTIRILVNCTFGGYSIPENYILAVYPGLSNDDLSSYTSGFKGRTDDKIIDELLSHFNPLHKHQLNCVCRLRVVEIPIDADYTISEYDGLETLHWSLGRIYSE
jgi:hypothetical protein